MKAFATFETPQAYRHLSTLCHHFGRKVDATGTAQTARIVFPCGQCDMEANDHQLTLWAHADNEGCLDNVVEVMTRHLERFAFRENPHLDWHPTPGAGPDR